MNEGESLWALARQYGVSVEALQAANGLGASSSIRAGQTLSIPVTGKKSAIDATAPSPSASKRTRATNEATPDGKAKAPAKSQKVTKPTTTKGSANTAPPAAASVRVATTNPAKKVTPKSASFPPIEPGAREKAEQLYSKNASTPAPSTLSERAPPWVLAAPDRLTQGEKPSAARGGVFPCAAPDPGFGEYGKWVQVAPMAHVLAQKAGPRFQAVREDGGFNVLFHFHGREPIRKEWVRAMTDAPSAVLVAIDIGIASESYRETFRDPRTFSQVLLAVESEIRRRSGNPKAFAQNIALSAWSAGYGAIEQLLTQPSIGRVGSVVLLDSLHAGFANESLDGDRLLPFVQFAKLAAKGKRLMFVSHSSIRTTGYASTTQTTNYLTWKVGGDPRSVTPLPSDPMGLDRVSSYSQANFHARGFRGSGASDHCAHLGLMRDVLSVHLLPLWQNSPAKNEATPLRVADND